MATSINNKLLLLAITTISLPCHVHLTLNKARVKPCVENSRKEHFASTWCICNPGYKCVGRYCEASRACTEHIVYHAQGRQNDSDAMCVKDPNYKEPAPSPACSKGLQFIHIDKSGGSSIKKWMHELFADKKTRFAVDNNHNLYLGGGCEDDCFVTFLRDPVLRWLSRFAHYKRLSTTAQFNTQAWAILLHEFKNVDEYIGGFDSDNETIKKTAKQLFVSRQLGVQLGLANHYFEALHEPGVKERIFYIGATHELKAGFKEFLQKANMLSEASEVNLDKLLDHKHNANPDGPTVIVTEATFNMVYEWFKEDYKIIKELQESGFLKHDLPGLVKNPKTGKYEFHG